LKSYSVLKMKLVSSYMFMTAGALVTPT